MKCYLDESPHNPIYDLRAQKLSHKYGPGGSYTLADGSNKLSDFINGSHWCHLTFVNDSGQSGPPI